MFFSQVFTSRSFTLALQYLRGVLCCFRFCLRGFNLLLFYNKTQTLVDIESAVAKQTKKVQFCFFQNILPVSLFTTVKGIFKNTF